MNGDKAAEGVSILLVDDDATKRLVMKSLLLPLGHTVVEADSGLSALRCLMENNYAVILLDVHMPVMDGFETAAAIRQRRQSEMTPIIFVTAYAADEISPAARFVEGAVDFIFAPVSPDELRAKVTVFANLFLQARRLAAEAEGVQAAVDQLTVLTDEAPIGIFRTDAEHRYVYTNPRWSDITGISQAAAQGMAWVSIIDAEHGSTTPPESADLGSNTCEIIRRFEVSVSGALTRTVQETSRPITGACGEVIGWVGTMADISAETLADLALSEAREKADEVSRLKSDFLANMSHEIRTPMNGVIGMADVLLQTNLDAQQRDYAETVRNSAEALLIILNDILDYSKIAAGGFTIEDVEFDVSAITSGVVALLTGIAQAKGLDLSVYVSERVPGVVSGDPGRIRQILMNLVGNAIKFTHAGEIVVRVLYDDDHANGDRLRFEVTDTGTGIPADKLALIFEPFVQADTSISRRFGGTGLGLAICGGMVALMGGECGVSSCLNVGSSFWFTVAVHVRARHRAPSNQSSCPQLAGVGPALAEGIEAEPAQLTEELAGKLLLAEDNLVNQKVAVAMLSGAGYEVDTVGDGAAAVEAAAAQSYDAILMDCQMPELDGYEATALIRAHEASDRHTPIIAMTAGARQEDQTRCLMEGMDDYIAKPVSRDALLALVGRYVGAGKAAGVQ